MKSENQRIGAADVVRRLAAEAIGSVLLAATVIGSGIMAAQLSAHNDAVALLANTFATVAVLVVLINLLGPISGAHFNPAVSFVEALRGRMNWRDAGAYAVTQTGGCCLGALLAHAMFGVALLQTSSHMRTGPGQWLSETVATGGLILVVTGHRKASEAPWLVAAWIGAAYWFTASTSFANPAISIARALTNTFAGIRPADVPPFILAQLVGASVSYGIANFLFRSDKLKAGPMVPARARIDTGARGAQDESRLR